MMQRYDSPADAVPHEMNVLVLSETGTCFGRPYEAIFDAVRDRLSCEKLLLEENHHDLENFPERELLIQHGIWLVRHDCLDGRDAYPRLHHYLATGSYPDETAVVVCVDPTVTDTHRQVAAKLDARYDTELAIATSHDALVSYLEGFLDAVNPCSQAGLEYVMRWNNDVCDELDVV